MDRSELWTVRHGHADAPPIRIPLRAGPLSLVFEDGDLRYLRLGNREVIRRVYSMVRDAAWNTFPPHITILAQEIGQDSFAITCSAVHRGLIAGGGEVHVESRLTAVGTEEGAISYRMDGRALLPFASNRVGLCVLHPTPEVLGAEVTIEHVDGTLESGVFPRGISETLPFTDIRSVTHAVAPGQRVRVTCLGATFEMEDQRNYGDASFKTFSTPLRLPKPVLVTPTTPLSQEIQVAVLGGAVAAVALPDQVTVAIGATSSQPLPRMGFAHQGAALSAAQLALVRDLRPAHLHVELALAQPGWPGALAATAAQAVTLGCPLQVCVLIAQGPAAEHAFRELAATVARLAIRVSALVVCAPKIFPSAALLQQARRILAPSCPGARLVGGSWSGYCLMNERRPDFASLDGVAFECNPQGHAADPSTVMENLAALVDSVASLRALCGPAEVLIAPLRFMPRDTEAANSPRRAVDPRLTALFGAAWSCGALGGLLAQPPDSVSAFDLLGPNGLLSSASGAAGDIRAHPLYHVFADLAEVAAGQSRAVVIDQPLRIAAWCVALDGRTRLQIANLRSEPTALTVIGLPGPVRLRCLDEHTALEAATAPERWRCRWSTHALEPDATLTMTLAPYAVVLIESSGLSASTPA